MATTDYLNSVQELYIAYYQRPADPAGQQYWAERIDAQGGSLTGVIDAFASSTEAGLLYGEINGTTIGSVVDGVYMAAFNHAPDQAGRAWYIEQFNAGAITAGNIALAIIDGAQGGDATVLNNKLQAANAITSVIAQGIAYDEASTIEAREMLAGVSATVPTQADLTAQVISRLAEGNVSLGEGDDVLDVTAVDLSAVALNGGAGNDTLLINASGSSIAADISRVSGFEALNLVGLNQAALSFAALRDAGLTSLTLTNSSGGQVGGLAADSDLALAGGATGLTLAVGGSDTGADSLAVTLQGAGGSNASYSFAIDGAQSASVTARDADASVYQQTTLQLAAADELKSLRITGDEAVAFDGRNLSQLNSVDIGGLTAVSDLDRGEFTARISVGDGVAVTGSSGDDTLVFGDRSMISGNGGDDLFVIESNGGQADYATITDFDAGDQLELGVVVSMISPVLQSDLGFEADAAATFEQYVTAATPDTVDGAVRYFVFQSDTYIVQDRIGQASGSGFVAGEDLIVKLSGLVDLSTLDVTNGTIIEMIF